MTSSPMGSLSRIFSLHSGLILPYLLQKNLFNTDIDLLLENVSGRIDDGYRAELTRLLQLPQQIRSWRSIIWEVIGESVYQRVQSFAELATALYSFSSTRSFSSVPPALHGAKLSPVLTGFFRIARADDEMRNFLIGAIDYLSSFTEGNIEIPVSIIRAMNDAERIAQIEESVLPAGKTEPDSLLCAPDRPPGRRKRVTY